MKRVSISTKLQLNYRWSKTHCCILNFKWHKDLIFKIWYFKFLPILLLSFCYFLTSFLAKFWNSLISANVDFCSKFKITSTMAIYRISGNYFISIFIPIAIKKINILVKQYSDQPFFDFQFYLYFYQNFRSQYF